MAETHDPQRTAKICAGAGEDGVLAPPEIDQRVIKPDAQPLLPAAG